MVDCALRAVRLEGRPLHLSAPRPARRTVRHRRRAGRRGVLVELIEEMRRLIDDLLAKWLARSPTHVLRGDDGDRLRDLPARAGRRRGARSRPRRPPRLDEHRRSPLPRPSRRSISITSSISATRSPPSPPRKRASSGAAFPSSSARSPTEARDVIVSMCELAGAEFIEADAGVQHRVEERRTAARRSD